MQRYANILSCFWLLFASYVLISQNYYTSKVTGSDQSDTISFNLLHHYLLETLNLSSANATHGLLINNSNGAVETVVTCDSRNDTNCFVDPVFAYSKWEPGSVFKPILVADLLDKNFITKSSVFSDDGSVTANGFRIDNVTQDIGKQYNILEFLGMSRNTGAVTILKTLNKERRPYEVWRKHLLNIFDSRYTYIPDFEHTNKPELRFYESSFGVGVTVTPLEITRVYASITNNGNKCEDNSVCTSIFLSETAAYMSNLLYKVAHDYANVTSASNTCRFGGKSGTALHAQNDGVYNEGKNIGTYIGYIQDTTNRPGYTLLVRVDEPLDELASRQAKLGWIKIADKICSELMNK